MFTAKKITACSHEIAPLVVPFLGDIITKAEYKDEAIFLFVKSTTNKWEAIKGVSCGVIRNKKAE